MPGRRFRAFQQTKIKNRWCQQHAKQGLIPKVKFNEYPRGLLKHENELNLNKTERLQRISNRLKLNTHHQTLPVAWMTYQKMNNKRYHNQRSSHPFLDNRNVRHYEQRDLPAKAIEDSILKMI